MDTPEPAKPALHSSYDSAELGALAHLYRGEVYRSTIWRTRLDNTTNWSVATLGIALSVTFSSADASPLPLLLVGVLVSVFMLFEARRYRYFNVWRARCRWLETHFYAPMLRGEGVPLDGWHDILANDYCEPRHHISLARAVGRRLRRTYGWILAIQALAYFGKLVIHPYPLTHIGELWGRAAVGPVPGEVIVVAGVLFNGAWIVFGLVTRHIDRTRHRGRTRVAMG
jgi:uncharacterized membrane protein